MSVEAAMQMAADRIGCDLPAIKALFEVEAAGKFHDKFGAPISRFEPHHFPRKHWSALGFSTNGQAAWRASLKVSRTRRAAMYKKAWGIDPEATARATSYGAPQIMGFNHEAAGFPSARSMKEAFKSAGEQIKAFANLVISWGLDGAIRSHDWQRVETRYNGGGFGGAYARKMAAAYKRHSGGQTSVMVLRVGSSGASVEALQKLLEAAGYKVTVDAAFGPGTLEAVKSFQRDKGLTVDGVVGAATWAALKKAKTSPAVIEPEPQPESSFADLIVSIFQSLFGSKA